MRAGQGKRGRVRRAQRGYGERFIGSDTLTPGGIMGRHGGSHRWHVQDRSPHGAQGRGGLPQGAPSLQLGRRRHLHFGFAAAQCKCCAPWGRSSLPIAGVGKASRFTARWSASRCGDPFRCWTTGGRVYWRKKGHAPGQQARRAAGTTRRATTEQPGRRRGPCGAPHEPKRGPPHRTGGQRERREAGRGQAGRGLRAAPRRRRRAEAKG